MMCIFVFLLNAEELYQYPLEPWAIDRLGPGNAWILSTFYIIFILINTIFVIIAAMLTKRLNGKKILNISIFMYCIITVIAPWQNILMFFILIAIQQVFASFLLIYYTALMISVSEKRVLAFQLIASAMIVAKLFFTPLGTYLTEIISTEWIITIAGIVQLFCLIPLAFISGQRLALKDTQMEEIETSSDKM